MKTHVMRMVQSMEWADKKVVAALREAPAVPAEALRLLSHLVTAERVWISRIRGQDSTTELWSLLTLSECERLAAEVAADLRALVDGATDTTLNEGVRYKNTTGEAFGTPLVDILTHLVIHGAYHRGQIAKVLGQEGMSAVNTDYITFVRHIG